MTRELVPSTPPAAQNGNGDAQPRTFKRVEAILHSYPDLKQRYEALLPRAADVPGGLIALGRTPQEGDSRVARLATELASISAQIDAIRRCLRLMTKDEAEFVRLRYFGHNQMKYVVPAMRWSRSQVYRLRTSVLLKAAWYFGFYALD